MQKNNGIPPTHTPTPTPTAAKAAITSISPTTGPGNTKVTIYGTEFGTTATAGMVTVNGDTASVQSVSPDSIVVTVPVGAGTGLVKVTVNGVTVTGPTFTYIPTYVVSTLAGNGIYGFQDGPGASAEFHNPTGVAVDGQGNVYVADWGNMRIRKITPAGMVSTIIGDGTAATLPDPNSVAVDGLGNIFVTEDEGLFGTNYVFMYNSQLVPTQIGVTDEETALGNILGLRAVDGCAVAPGNAELYVADPYDNQIVSFTYSPLPATSSVVSGGSSINLSVYSEPVGVAVNAQGTVYVSDQNYAEIDETSGTGYQLFAGTRNSPGFEDGPGATAKFGAPYGIAVDSKGNVYVADYGNNAVRMITPAGVVSTLAGYKPAGSDAAGTVPGGFQDGPASSALFNGPTGVAVDAQGNVYVADQENCRIRKISIQ